MLLQTYGIQNNDYINSFEESIDLTKDKKRTNRIILLIVEIILAVFAILFVKPHPYDQTAEMIRSIWPDSEPAVLVHTILPIFLYPVFYLVWHFIAKRVAPGREILFLAVVYTFYAVQIFVDGYIGLAVYRNIANPVTLFVSVILPLIIACLAGIGNQAKQTKASVNNATDTDSGGAYDK